MTNRRWLGSLVLFVALATLAACGSTVQQGPHAASGTQVRGNNGEVTGEFGPSGAGDTGTGTDGSTSGGSTSGGSGGTVRRTTSGSGGGASGPGNASTAVGPGVTNDKIYVGDAYAVNSSAANAAIGAAGITQGDTKTEAKIVVDDINAHGGVAGRKIEIVWHELDGASTATYNTIEQNECDDWTQDHKVFAAFTAGGETMMQCLHNRGVIELMDDLTSADTATFRRYPYYVELSTINLDRAAATLVASLKTQGWFSGWSHVTGSPAATKAKVGIVTYDGPSWDHAVDGVLIPALRAAGYAPAPEDVIRVQPPGQTADTGPIGAAASSAVLKLRSDNVDHVFVFDERALLSLFFLQSADSQGYRPRYGVTSQNGMQALMDGSNLPKRQLIGSMGIGWSPGIDITPSQNTRTGPYSNDQRKKCLSLMESKGITFADANAETIGMGICATYWFFRDAVAAGGNVMNRNGFMNGVAKLGTSFLDPGAFANRFSATQRDGAAAYRNYGFNEQCGCMKYTSGNISA
jgi:hypothetical protein